MRPRSLEVVQQSGYIVGHGWDGQRQVRHLRQPVGAEVRRDNAIARGKNRDLQLPVGGRRAKPVEKDEGRPLAFGEVAQLNSVNVPK
jgi:hypothetical protein